MNWKWGLAASLSVGFLLLTVIVHFCLWYFLKCLDEAEFYPDDPEKMKDYQQRVDEINRNNFTWKARVYPRLEINIARFDASVADLENGQLAWQDEKLKLDSLNYALRLDKANMNIPEDFDARKKWPLCSSLHNVKNQGSCGSCWAEAATSVIADRLCIASNGSLDVEISSQDVVECCAKCNGCQGSMTQLHIFNHYVTHGIVTGGRYKSNEGCKPFKFPSHCGTPCGMDVYETNSEKGRNSNCIKQCRNGYHKSYEEDKHYGSTMYAIGLSRLSNEYENLETVQLRLQKELILNGPLSVCPVMPISFLLYSTGIFSATPFSPATYGHCFKIIGWGVQKYEGPGIKVNHEWVRRVPYWLIVNSWGRDWGENGLAKISWDPFRDFYNDIVVALPSLSKQ